MKVVAVVGLGRMGGGIAGQLCRQGFAVKAYDLSEQAMEAAASNGAETAASARHAAVGADAVITSLPTPETVVECYEELLVQASDALFIDVSTVDPVTAKQIQDRVKTAGGRFVACPLGKGPQQAATGESPLFIGGDPDAIDDAADILEAIGGPKHRLGTVEAATTFKLVSNMIAFANLATLCEGYLVARGAGIDGEAFAAALLDTGGMSYQAELRLPWIMKNDLSPRFAVDLARKDLRLGVDLAARQGAAVPVTAAALQELVLAAAQGLGGYDAAAIVSVLAPGFPGTLRHSQALNVP